MATPAEIEQQVKLEREQIAQGLAQLQDNTAKLQDKDYASATVYGVASIEQLIPLVVERIEHTNSRIHLGKNGVAFREIREFLKDIEPEAAASIACKVTFDKVFSSKPRNSTVQNVTDAIGQAIENECRYYLSAGCPLLPGGLTGRQRVSGRRRRLANTLWRGAAKMIASQNRPLQR